MTDTPNFPAEFPADPAGAGKALGWTIGVLAPTALALAVFNAEAIASWTQDLPAAPSTAKAMAAAEAWKAGTAEFGLDAPRKGLHLAWKRAQAMRWLESRRSKRMAGQN